MSTLFLTLAFGVLVDAHISAWAKGMYCLGGADPTIDNANTNTAVGPLFDLPQDQWWFQADRGCNKVPPADGDILSIPAGGSFTVELANNRAFTTLSYNGTKTSEWPDGGVHPEDWHETTSGDCLPDGGWMHAQNESMTQGTAWAISYESELEKVTMENLVVFSVLEHSPWKRLVTYEAPAALPPCPEGGCTCAWLWAPLGCGQSNMYMTGFKCNVTDSTATTPLAKAKPPVMCGDDSSKCTKGAKQMIAWHQASGNNINTTGTDFSIPANSPAYNSRCGWTSGAQNDIFEDEDEADDKGTGSVSASVSVVRTATTFSVAASGSTSPFSPTTMVTRYSKLVSLTTSITTSSSTTEVAAAITTSPTTSPTAIEPPSPTFTTTVTPATTSDESDDECEA
ncbi:MAG: hypothetical protein M1834_005410 [Cirrosporium novae-zelandiae]|nr:MAG: hypothetical protein M1834_005410 [Cirrosporium novae-zelandiae]